MLFVAVLLLARWEVLEYFPLPATRPSAPTETIESSVLDAPPSALDAPPSAPHDPMTAFFEWMQSETSSRDDGIRLAQERRTEIYRLMKERPGRAAMAALSWSQWNALSDEIKPWVETPISVKADVAVLPNCGLDGLPAPDWQEHHLMFDGIQLAAYVYGRREFIHTKSGQPVQGFVLDDRVVLFENTVQILTSADYAIVSDLFPNGHPPDRSFLTGEPLTGEPVAALIGGEIFHFADEEEALILADALAEAEKGLGPHSVRRPWDRVMASGGPGLDLDIFASEVIQSSSAWTETEKKALVLRLDFASGETNDYSQAQVVTIMNAASNHIYQFSYAKTWIVPTVTSNLTLPQSRTFYETNSANVLAQDALAVATNAGFVLSNYDIYVFHHPTAGVGYGGLAQVGGAWHWLNGIHGHTDNAVHEFGHNYGVGHANLWRPYIGSGFTTIYGDHGHVVAHQEYGDLYDRMGGGPSNGHYSASMKHFLNWLEEDRVRDVTQSGLHHLYRFDHVNAMVGNPGQANALRITTPDGHTLWVAYRQSHPDPASMEGLYLAWQYLPHVHRMIDASPLVGATPDADRADALIKLDQTWRDPSGSVRITPLLIDNGVPGYEYIALLVNMTHPQPSIEFFTDTNLTTKGLTGSYVNGNLIGYAPQDDWRVTQTISGTRVDADMRFTNNGWGVRSTVGITGGTDANWDNFSVQWDGFMRVNQRARVATVSDDGSRMWIDTDHNGTFATNFPEFIDNLWGTPHGTHPGDPSISLVPGVYRVRIQYQDSGGDNRFWVQGDTPEWELFTPALDALGLEGSYVDQNLRSYAPQDDWRTSQTIAGMRVDAYPGYSDNDSWGSRSSVGLTGASWTDFSVQWDGWIRHFNEPRRFTTASDDGSRMWIDFDNNGTFGATPPEFINNNWGSGQNFAYGDLSPAAEPSGVRRIRIQYEQGSGGTALYLAGVSTNAYDDHANSIEEATFIPAPATAVFGWISAGETGDFFRIDIDLRGTLTVYSTGSIDTFGHLLDGNGTQIAQNDDSGDGTNFQIVHPALTPGTYYVRVRGFNAAVTGYYSVAYQFAADPPVQVVTPTLIEHSVIQGQVLTQTVAVINAGYNYLNYSVSKDQAWVTVSPTNGVGGEGETNLLQVVMNSTGLPAGTNTAQLTVASQVATTSVTVNLDVYVPTPATLNVDPLILHAQAFHGAVVTQTVTIWNTGELALDYVAFPFHFWVELQPDSGNIPGGETNTIQVRIDAAFLTNGFYQSNLEIWSPNSSEIIPLTVDVHNRHIVVNHPGNFMSAGDTVTLTRAVSDAMAHHKAFIGFDIPAMGTTTSIATVAISNQHLTIEGPRPLPQQDHVIGLWRFNFRTNSVSDYSGYNRPATLVAPGDLTTFDEGRPGSGGPAFASNGSGGDGGAAGYAVVNNAHTAPSLMPEEFTIAAWIHVNTFGAQHGVVGCATGDVGYGLHLTDDARFAFRVGATGIVHTLTSALTYPTGQWHHVAAAFADGVMRLAVNGQSAGVFTNGAAMNRAGAPPLEVGRLENQRIDALIDDVIVWDRALTPTELTASYYAPPYAGPHPRVVLDAMQTGRVVTVGEGSDLRLRNLHLRGGAADAGAGIHNASNSITWLENVIISDNLAAELGGGIRNMGFLVMDDSHIHGNATDVGAPDGSGGGLHTIRYTHIRNSTFSDNHARGDVARGGGIFFMGNSWDMHLQQCTISGNEAKEGGGVYITTNSQAYLYYCTIVFNTADDIAGGVRSFSMGFNTPIVYHSIIADNAVSAPITNGINLAGNFASFGYNLFGDATSAVFVAFTSSTSLFETPSGISPWLGRLGGPTPVHPLQWNSPALDAGHQAISGQPLTDQRGAPRILNGRIDIGAYEHDPAELLTLLIDTDGDGLPDLWEAFYGLDPADPGDAHMDYDGDGTTAYTEYRAGTHPRDIDSVFQVVNAFRAPGSIELRWASVASKTYCVYYSHDLTDPPIFIAGSIAATPPENVVYIIGSFTDPMLFFWVATE